MKKLTRRGLIAGGVAAGALPVLHEVVPHQGLHDRLASGFGRRGMVLTTWAPWPATDPIAAMAAHGGGVNGPTFKERRGRRPRGQRLQPDRHAPRLRLGQGDEGWRAGGRCASGRSSPPTRRSRLLPASSTRPGPTTGASRPDAPMQRGRPASDPLRQRLRPSPHDALPRTPSGRRWMACRGSAPG